MLTTVPEKCDCSKYPLMHDSNGVCTKWEWHGSLPCNKYHDTIHIAYTEAIERMNNA